jgi:hypothetical protein
MAELNHAYDAGDELRIRGILREWEEGMSARENLSVGAQLVKTIRKIAQARARLEGIRAEIEEMENSEMCRLRQRVETARQEGRDVMDEMTRDIEDKIVRVIARARKLADELTYL